MPSRLPALPLAALLLLAALLVPILPASAAPFVDAAGRRVLLPGQIFRVLPADRNAEVLVLALAPDKLGGLEETRESRAAMTGGRSMPALDWGPRTSPAAMAAAARQVGADLIIDAGSVTPERAAFADAAERLSGIPYILIDDSFSRMPDMLRTVGALLGVTDRAGDLALFADHAISGLRGRLLITPPDTRPHVYYGLGHDGLTTPLPGSPASAALDEAGAINVAAPLGQGTEARVSPAQLFDWNPPIIIAEHRRFYEALRHDPALRRLAAVRDHKVYLEPTEPFGWIDDPTGINRLIGLHWLSTLFYATATQEDLRTTVCDFYDKFYRVKLTNAQIETLVRPAGAPPPEAGHFAPEPLIGLGAAPVSTLPPNTPGASSAATPVAPLSAAPQPAIAAGASPSAITGVPGLPNTAPNATCTIPTGPLPQPLPGLYPAPSSVNPPGGNPPGLPPGRRGRAMPGIETPETMTR